MKICIIGTGSFGIALASNLIKNNNNVIMWSKFEEEINELNTTRICLKLNSYSIPDEIKFSSNMAEALKDAKIIVIAVPANFVYTTILEMKNFYNSNQHICIASKGMDENRGEFLHNIVKENLNTDKVCLISGPSFAIDIVENVPAGVTLASQNIETSKICEQALNNQLFKVVLTDDLIGISICGCVKNIIAIGSGIINGMGYPISTSALLITLALNDIKKLILCLGGKTESILELAGIGDIILTCTSIKSRNFSFGKVIGESNNQQVIDNYVHNNTVEGYYSLKNINKIVDNLHINTPFIKIMYDIVIEQKSKSALINYITK
ncbi:MAG: NAD(P)H-dependent glycerol-3-phosphate dehydrogenase [Bacilli bacterium]|nr:NAD(P)H-dependent glycerol-3-phosphate dehydrogenase [Bacilli bacterium]